MLFPSADSTYYHLHIKDEEEYEAYMMLLEPYMAKMASEPGEKPEREEILKKWEILCQMDDLYRDSRGLAAAKEILTVLSYEDLERMVKESTEEACKGLFNILNVPVQKYYSWYRYVALNLLFPLIDQYFDGACGAEANAIMSGAI